MREFAAELDVNHTDIQDVYTGRRDPGPTLLRKLKVKKTVQKTVIYSLIK